MNNIKEYFFLKKYIPIYKAFNKICIGFVGSDNYLEIDYSKNNYNLLESLLKEGVEESYIEKTSLYSELHTKNFLEINPLMLDQYSSRSELYLEYLLNRNISKDINIVKDKTILIFGAGAGGSTLIYLLAQFGFKNIYIIDYDVVEETDLRRVTIFDESDIGNKKIFSLKEKIKQNFSININIIDANLTKEKEIEEVICSIKPEFIVKACDPAGIFLTNLNKICFNYKIPYISMAYSYELLKIGPLLVPDITSCSESLSKSAVEHYGGHYKVESFEKIFNNYLFHPSISFNINILSSIIFKEILFFLIGEYNYCQTIGRIITFNPLSFSTNSYLIKCDDNCKLCFYEGKTI